MPDENIRFKFCEGKLKTYIPKKDQVKSKWYIVDASGKVLGRMASNIARILRYLLETHGDDLLESFWS